MSKPCTAENPIGKGVGHYHPDAVEIGEQRDGYPGGDMVLMRCPHCGYVFDCELPQ